MNIKESIFETLKLFEELSRIPFSKIFDDSSSFLGKYEHDNLILASKLDDGLFIMGINSYFKSYSEVTTFALNEFLEDSDVYARIDKHKKLNHDIKLLMEHGSVAAQLENILSVIANFSERNLTCEEQESIKNDVWKSFVRGYDFIRNLKRRKIGKINENSVFTSKFDRRIYFVESEAHVLDLAHHAKPGLYTIAVIDNNNPSACHFNLVIKTSDGAVIINDSERKAYGEQERRTDRQNIQRINKSLFPYSVFDLTAAPSGKHLMFSETSKSTALTHYDGIKDSSSVIINVREIKELPFSELCELSVLYASIALDWKSFIDSEELIYGHEISFSAESNAMPVVFKGSEKQFNLPKTPSREDFYSSSRDSSDYATAITSLSGTDYNTYFESVFSKEVNKVQILPSNLALEHKDEQTSKNIITIPEDVVGSPEKIIADTVFQARSQQAKNLSKKIDNYFEEHFDDMAKWIVERIDTDKLIQRACAKLALPQPENCPEWMKTQEFESKTARYGANSYHVKGKYTRRESDTYRPRYPIYLNKTKPNLKESGMVDLLCVECNNFANFFVEYTITDAYDISFLTNTPVDELPFHLKEFGVVRYTGNSLLYRVDPIESMDHRFQNHQLDLRLMIGFSLKGLNAVREQNGHSKLSRTEAEEMFGERYSY
ncbi:hypothetical protein [Vibrio metschnikovii]|uniref:Uncharacterized protein n=1 Tax=Vibrio metschnikovii TaxID=28172 RepID=A0A9X0R7Y5_VIBME|nr:hypothetical protein [Vibrio metschnikovii]MBC5851272.1 hypothetical protein [Vibrio metschnikovii]